MRISLAALGVLLLVGCAPPPTAPDAGLASSVSKAARLWGMAIEPSGICIAGARVVVIAGQSVGTTVVQETPCDVWGYGGGFTLTGLTPGASMTLRVSAPGYVTRDISTTPTASQSTVFEIVLTRNP